MKQSFPSLCCTSKNDLLIEFGTFHTSFLFSFSFSVESLSFLSSFWTSFLSMAYFLHFGLPQIFLFSSLNSGGVQSSVYVPLTLRSFDTELIDKFFGVQFFSYIVVWDTIQIIWNGPSVVGNRYELDSYP